MGMSSAHIFYIPIIFFIGIFAGFFMGRRAAENEARELKKRRERRQAIREHAAGSKEQGAQDEAAGQYEDADKDEQAS